MERMKAMIILHRPGGADAVERLDHEIGVAQPAIAIVPVAPGIGRFRQRGGQRRHDAAGLLEIGKLQGDGGADGGVLPFIGEWKAAAPIRANSRWCGRRKSRAVVAGIAGEGLIRPEHQMQRAGSARRRRLLLDIGQRRIGGEPDQRRLAIGDMVGARHLPLASACRNSGWGARRMVMRGMPATGSMMPHQLRRPQHAVEIAEARREIGDRAPADPSSAVSKVTTVAVLRS